MIVEVGDVVEDHGTTVTFDGHVVYGEDVSTEGVRFAVDHRQAQPLVDALAEGDYWPWASIEDWQVLGRV